MIATLESFYQNFYEFPLEILIFGLFFLLLERLHPAQKPEPFYEKKGFKAEITFAAMNSLFFGPFFAFTTSYLLFFVLDPFIEYQIFNDTLSNQHVLLQVILAILTMDFSTYWRHRFTHRYMWPVHAVHHSAEELIWTTAKRLHPLEVAVASICDLTLLYFIGFSGSGAALAILIMIFYNYFTHANLDLEYPAPVRYIFASPNFHRWHHAVEKKAWDKNFCSIISFYDLIFGTYYHPQGELPKAYGLSKKEQKNYPEGIDGQLLYPFRSKQDHQ